MHGCMFVWMDGCKYGWIDVFVCVDACMYVAMYVVGK